MTAASTAFTCVLDIGAWPTRDAAELSRYRQTGGILSMRVDAPGLPEAHFRG